MCFQYTSSPWCSRLSRRWPRFDSRCWRGLWRFFFSRLSTLETVYLSWLAWPPTWMALPSHWLWVGRIYYYYIKTTEDTMLPGSDNGCSVQGVVARWLRPTTLAPNMPGIPVSAAVVRECPWARHFTCMWLVPPRSAWVPGWAVIACVCE